MHSSEYLAIAHTHHDLMTNNPQLTHHITSPITYILKDYIKNPALLNTLINNQNIITNKRSVKIYIGGKYKTTRNHPKQIAFSSAYTITINNNLVATLLSKNNNSPN